MKSQDACALRHAMEKCILDRTRGTLERRTPACYGKMHPGQDKRYAGKARSGMLWKGDSDEIITGKNGK